MDKEHDERAHWRISSSPALLDHCVLPGLEGVENPPRGSANLRAQQPGGHQNATPSELCDNSQRATLSPLRIAQGLPAGRDGRPSFALRCGVHAGPIVARAFDMAVGTVALDWWPQARRMDGGSIDVPPDQRGDIYIDAAVSTATEAWLDPVKAQAWVLPLMKGQGIIMRAA